MTLNAAGPLRLPDDRLTADRDETKYLVGGDRLAPLLALLSKHLPQHRFTGEGANLLPGAWHLVTTIYFDTPARTHYRAAIGDIDHNVKIRAKEYYDLHPSLAELATDPADIVRYQPWIWFEMKRRDGARTIKHRFRLPKRDVPACLNGGQVVPEALALPVTGVVPADSERAGIREIVAYCRALGEPLAATCLVNYRRLSWQQPDGDLRVTLDSELAFYAVPTTCGSGGGRWCATRWARRARASRARSSRSSAGARGPPGWRASWAGRTSSRCGSASSSRPPPRGAR